MTSEQRPTSPSTPPPALDSTSISSGNPSTQSRRSVSFPSSPTALHTVVCYIETREELDNVEDLYFTRTDYQASRSAAKTISKEAERCGYSKNLVDTFSSKSSDIQERLNLWAVHGHSRRGLERWANSKHGEERQQEQFQAIMAVLRAQDDMLAKKSSTGGAAVLDCEKLRKISYKATKTSRHFARMLGKADSYAMAQELKQEQDGLSQGQESSVALDDDLQSQAGVDDATASSFGDNISMPGGDFKESSNPSSINNSQHTMTQRLKRFGFGRKKAEERVSRVA
jgi:hypothetical protein